jgi:hypothetical protein
MGSPMSGSLIVESLTSPPDLPCEHACMRFPEEIGLRGSLIIQIMIQFHNREIETHSNSQFGRLYYKKCPIIKKVFLIIVQIENCS